MRVPFPASSGKDSQHCRRISRGGALNWNVERNSRGRATIPKVSKCLSPLQSAGSQREEFHPWQGHAARALMARLIRPQVFPLEFPEHPPPKIRISSLLTFSGKSQFRALVFCIWKSISIQKPLWWLSSLPAGLVQLPLWLFEASWLQEA